MTPKLKRLFEQFILYYFTPISVQEVCTELDITRPTYYKWLKNPKVIEAIEEKKDHLSRQVNNIILELTTLAGEKLKEQLDNDNPKTPATIFYIHSRVRPLVDLDILNEKMRKLEGKTEVYDDVDDVDESDNQGGNDQENGESTEEED